jgi:hypothetical protein
MDRVHDGNAQLTERPQQGVRGLEIAGGLAQRFLSIFRDKNRRDIGKSQSKWTARKMETPPRTVSCTSTSFCGTTPARPNGLLIEAPCRVNGEHGASLRQPVGSPSNSEPLMPRIHSPATCSPKIIP